MDENDPVTLREACEIVFRGQITPQALRLEAARGRLSISRIGGKDWTTLRDARELLEKCRVGRSGQDCTGTEPARSGSSETAQHTAARAAAQETVRRLKKPWKGTWAGSFDQAQVKPHS